MKNTFGNNLAVTLFGESHGRAVGAIIDGLPAGIEINENYIKSQLDLRKPYGEISTKRVESDEFEILSGVFDGKTVGTAICIVIKNQNTKSKDYSEIKNTPRPSHADYVAHIKYNSNEDYRGGGHFSGRITAALVAAGAIIKNALEQKGILIGSHISNIGEITDLSFNEIEKEIISLNKKQFAVIDDTTKEKMIEKITEIGKQGDSIGGSIETAVLGLPVGVGEPWFDSVESCLSHAVFSVPAVKGVEFGAGFQFSKMLGSVANDELEIVDSKIQTKSNNNGGINGGITNGMPIVFKTAIKPTPSIAKPQKTVDLETKQNVEISIKGRHDPCIVHRARVVIDSVTAIAICDLLITKYGTDWLVK